MVFLLPPVIMAKPCAVLRISRMISELLLAVILLTLLCTLSVASIRTMVLSSRALLKSLPKHSSSQRRTPLANISLKFPLQQHSGRRRPDAASVLIKI